MRAQRIRRTKRDEELEPEPEPAPQPVPQTPQTRALELQKSAGNRAVARWAGPWLAQRKSQARWPEESQVLVEGETVPLESWWWNETTTATGIGGGKFKPTRATINTRRHDVANRLRQASESGRQLKSVTIVYVHRGEGGTITFKEVLVDSLEVKPETDVWTISFGSYEMGDSPPPT
jgi:hypothetical protein